MSFSCPDLHLSEMLDLARAHGYGGIEPRIEAGRARDVEVVATQAEGQRARRTL
jgi:hypothetical protein